MTEENRLILKDLLLKLKRVNKVYESCTEDQRGRLLSALETTFIKLEKFGMERSISTSLVVGGKEFLDSLYKMKFTNSMKAQDNAEIIFK